MKVKMLNILLGLSTIAIFSSCGGSGGSLKYPYETVYGTECIGKEPIPGCTFFRKSGDRITVVEDPHYSRYGNGSDDMGYVEFSSSGKARVYSSSGVLLKTTDVSNFAGYIGGTTIGVGTTGLYWENVANKTYWLGENGVLYSANSGRSNYGEAINNKNSGKATNTNILALKSAANIKLIDGAANRLVKNYGFTKEKATAVASALNSWAILGAERGYVTDRDMSKTFVAVFGVDFPKALAAVKSLQAGQKQPMREVTNRSAAALGLKPHQAQDFIKDMYRGALEEYGYDVKSINWME